MILFEKLPFEVILASNSPRRRELLSSLGRSFSIANDLKIDESYPENISTEEIPLYIARKKALAHSPLLTDKQLLITADTVVLAGDRFSRVLGKPHDERQAFEMLELRPDQTAFTFTSLCRFTMYSNNHSAHTAPPKIKSCSPKIGSNISSSPTTSATWLFA